MKSDPEAQAYLAVGELAEIFNYRYYTRYVDATFQRIGLLPVVAAI